MMLFIPRFCNRCGKKFIYSIDEDELHQQKQSIEYCCPACNYPEIKSNGALFAEKLVGYLEERFRNGHGYEMYYWNNEVTDAIATFYDNYDRH